MRPDHDHVLQTVSENREAVRRLGVRRLGLFGSCARGDSCDSSNLDFMVEFEENSFDGYMEFKALLEGLFHCVVDLVLIDAIKPTLKEPILQEAVYAPGL